MRKGKTNLQRMQEGLAPIGKDGKLINLHRMTQEQDGAITEMDQTFHQMNHSIIHIDANNIPSAIDRNNFNKWRSRYWQNRAKDF